MVNEANVADKTDSSERARAWVLNAVREQDRGAALEAVKKYLAHLAGQGGDKVELMFAMMDLFNAGSNQVGQMFPAPPPPTKLERARKRLENPPEGEKHDALPPNATKKVSKLMLWIMNECRVGEDIAIGWAFGKRNCDYVRTKYLGKKMLHLGMAKSARVARVSLSRAIRSLESRGLIETATMDRSLGPHWRWRGSWEFLKENILAKGGDPRVTAIRPVARWLLGESVDSSQVELVNS